MVPPRIYPGGLLVTRAFGDFHAKVPEYGGKEGVILHSFEKIFEIDLDENTEQIVLGTDGVFDAISGETLRIKEKIMFQNIKERKLREALEKVITGIIIDAKKDVHWRKMKCAPDNSTCVIIHLITKASKKFFGDFLH